jgi:transposase
MPANHFIHSILLPELKLTSLPYFSKQRYFLDVKKQTKYEVCPKCATKSYSIYDHVKTKTKDTPFRDKLIFLQIKKRRFYCKNCKSVFTEPVPGIKKGHRTTERLRRHIRWCADNFKNLKDVTRHLDCSSWLVHKAYYQQLDLELRKIQNPWASTIGIDEHFINRDPSRKFKNYGTIFVEYSHKRIREIIDGRNSSDLLSCPRLHEIPGREGVRNVIMDLSKPYHRFAHEFFPNAKIIADRFHVIRLINVIVNKYRKQVTGDIRKNPIRKLLLKKGKTLEPYVRKIIYQWLEFHPELKEIYHFKERLHGLYNIKGLSRARTALIKITDDMARSKIPELKTLRGTLHRWRNEIVNFFENGLTNGRTEGFNRKAKLIQRNAYGFKNFENYRKRLIYECS